MDRAKLKHLYQVKKKSMQEIAEVFGCSLHTVAYWAGKYQIESRSRSDATYLKRNPGGDPFKFIPPKSLKDSELFGLGMGLYWGEGTKADKVSVRLGNTDPMFIKKFMNFLILFFNVKKGDMHFGLQLFNDMDIHKALDFWRKELNIKYSQFYKPIITKSRSLGTYRKKSEYGVMTIYYHNKKMRDILVNMLPM